MFREYKMKSEERLQDFELFKEAVNGNTAYFRALSSKVDLKKLFCIGTPERILCLCKNEFERFLGSPDEMLAEFGEAVKAGVCDHCQGRPKCPQSELEAEHLMRMVTESDKNKFECKVAEALNMCGDTADTAGINLLHICAMFNHLELALWLIEKGVEIHSPTKRLTDPPIITAVHAGQEEMVQFLIASGTSPDVAANGIGDYPVYVAVRSRQTKILKLLIEKGFTVDDEVHFSRPLYEAMQLHDTECFQLLVEGGADANFIVNDYNGTFGPCSLLAYTITHFPHLAKLLLEGGLDVNDKFYRTADDMPPLHLAVGIGKSDLVELMLQKGADPNITSIVIGFKRSALFVAALANNIQSMKLLLQFGANKNHRGRNNYAVIHNCAWDGQLEMCKMLLDAGADYDSITDDKNTPLAFACHGDQLPVIKLFLNERTCNVNNKDKDLDTPILYTTFNSNYEATKLLVDHGADPTCINAYNTTPLWNAVYSGNVNIVMLLLEYNVPLSIYSRGVAQHAYSDTVVHIYDDPKSLLFVAFDKLHKTLPKILVSAGIDMAKERWLKNGNWPSQFNGDINLDKEVKEFFQNLKTELYKCRSLRELARIAIRKYVGSDLRNVYNLLELPVTLANYLVFKH